jgi:hypothetical protein
LCNKGNASDNNALLEKTPQTPVFVELFSSQACVFCPEADNLFINLISRENVYGVSCHIDYFDVKEGSLSIPECTNRQSWYMETLKAGPNYTPQMVVNGHIDVIAYKPDKVDESFSIVSSEDTAFMEISKTNKKDLYDLDLPAIQVDANSSELKLWCFLYNDYEGYTIKEGRNTGKAIDYKHIVTSIVDLGGWDGSQISRTINIESKDNTGFFIVAQDPYSGKIFAFGQYQQ